MFYAYHLLSSMMNAPPTMAARASQVPSASEHVASCAASCLRQPNARRNPVLDKPEVKRRGTPLPGADSDVRCTLHVVE
jgi:hypothetical protein